MSKRPTPKKRREKSRGRRQHSIYVQKRIRKLLQKQRSPYAATAAPKKKASKALKGITRIKA
ncbi:MAG TPA: hypothetical protein DEB30_04985 [Candidatus Peribacter riflensis]|uniref:Uncharacterized protein n=1 Tax=Candidatus Peribacter riflensis TaxID=1735162 RepID=A0A0S1SLV5_9BACT|nr:MAG: hypothetical protein PeribacterA2_0229 [Candidatus Peribacter riflensis]OGJ77295.1 MAG: hypothetical protein A2398_03920 [Candidatus Peribacteria bacterium RIFOXYB1_FULL_57_12]OGJ81994.1 MAG: hypothetical protein A2412_00870 [Candidatus Peribacteria bacterium RIFOXYC1_FULL_58_8]ALM10723.1 MAG: hypothetical protein PeribacterB2_0229 [Candidatus Peribacter riflensis]ALM11825.1 MAG: hypothetical protein PeribacterC2_0228 [Candidatus Peribacter riflensis]